MSAPLAAVLWLLPLTAALAGAARIGAHAGHGWRSRAGLAAAGTATATVLAAWAIVRLVDWLAAGGGPLTWSFTSVPTAPGPAPYAHAVGWIGAIAGSLAGVALVGHALWNRRQSGGRVAPYRSADLHAAALFAGAAVILMVTFAAAPVELAVAVPLDVIAVAPVVAAGLALRLLAAPMAAALPTPVREPARGLAVTASATAQPDLHAEVRRALGGANLAPVFVETARSSANGPPGVAADRLWRACGGLGRAPQAVLTVSERLGQGARGVLVGDLPPETERAFVSAVVGLALCERAARVLLICPDPLEQRARLLRALRDLGVRAPGYCIAGGGELKELRPGEAVPALIALDLSDLSGMGIARLGVSGSSWLAALDLIVLIGLESVLPIPATHLAFTLRRLAIATETLRASPMWVAVGDSTAGALRFVSRASAVEIDPLPLAAPDTAGVTVFSPAIASTPAAALDACARELLRRGLEVAIEAEELGALDRALPEARGRLAGRPGYTGRCSLALVHDRQLAGLFRARKNVAHRSSAGGHLACWWVPRTPLSRILLERGMLATLDAHRELTSPRPVAGLRNQYLAAEHLAAALREGQPDEAGLRRAFGDAAVDQFLATQSGLRVEGERALWSPASRTITRSNVVVSTAAPWPDLRRETVTGNVVEVRNGPDGRLLRRVDRRVAATRYYPHRVFAADGVLYQVGETAFPAGSRHVAVAVADAGTPLTDPDLELTVTPTGDIGEREVHEKGALRFARSVVGVTIHELVRGTIPRGETGAKLTYSPVTSRYPGMACVVSFPRGRSPRAVYHVARVALRLLPAHLRVDAEDVDVLVSVDGLAGEGGSGIVFVDRNLGGIGVAEALDFAAIHDLLRWTWWVLHQCACMDGCEICSPPEVLQRGRDKQGALSILGGK